MFLLTNPLPLRERAWALLLQLLDFGDSYFSFLFPQLRVRSRAGGLSPQSTPHTWSLHGHMQLVYLRNDFWPWQTSLCVLSSLSLTSIAPYIFIPSLLPVFMFQWAQQPFCHYFKNYSLLIQIFLAPYLHWWHFCFHLIWAIFHLPTYYFCLCPRLRVKMCLVLIWSSRSQGRCSV